MSAPKAVRILLGILKKLLIAALSLVVFVLVAELVARAAEPGPFSFLDENPYEKDRSKTFGLKQFHKPNFEGRWDSTWYSTNSIGMRGPEIEIEKPDDQFRIVAIGDSCTFGKGVTEANCWPRKLETLLREDGGGTQTPVVGNLGVNGFAGKDYIRMLRTYGVQLQPDVVVVGYNLNDFPNVVRKINEKVKAQTKPRQVIYKNLGKQNVDRLNESALFRFLRACWYEWNKERDWANAEKLAQEIRTSDEAAAIRKSKNPEFLEVLKGEIQELKTIANDAGAELAIFLFPYESQIYLDSYDTGPIDNLRLVCGELEVPFVSLEEKFRDWAHETDPPRRVFIFGDRYHPTADGYEIVARSVQDVLRENGWLPD